MSRLLMIGAATALVAMADIALARPQRSAYRPPAPSPSERQPQPPGGFYAGGRYWGPEWCNATVPSSGGGGGPAGPGVGLCSPGSQQRGR